MAACAAAMPVSAEWIRTAFSVDSQAPTEKQAGLYLRQCVERSVRAIGRSAEFVQNCLIFLLHLKNLSLLLHNLLLRGLQPRPVQMLFIEVDGFLHGICA